MAGTPGLRERKKAHTRSAIQSHALRLFRDHGYEATTVQHIVEVAEVSEATFFRYFPTKEDLVLHDGDDRALLASLNAQPLGGGPIDMFRAAFQAAFGDLSPPQRAEQRERIRLILTVPKLRERMLDRLRAAVHLVADALAGRTGHDPTDLEIRTLAGAIVGVALAVVEILADDPTADIPELFDRALAHLQRGLPL